MYGTDLKLTSRIDEYGNNLVQMFGYQDTSQLTTKQVEIILSLQGHSALASDYGNHSLRIALFGKGKHKGFLRIEQFKNKHFASKN